MEDKITMIELFSGIGAQERALRQVGIPYEIIATCDCDKDAVLSYASMRYNFKNEFDTYEFPSADEMIKELQFKNIGYDFAKNKHTITSRTLGNKIQQYYLADKLSKNLGDISKVERLPYADMVTYSFPCTDLSAAGKCEGMVNKCLCGYSWLIDFSNGNESLTCPNCGAKVQSSTRSGLLGQVQRLLAVSKNENTLPKYLLLENVKNFVGKKFKPQFDAWVKWLDSIGYNTYYEVLNAKHYGIPQNRERIFALSIRKDIDNGNFQFPEQVPLTTRLKDILEKNVDEKYYLSGDKVESILSNFIARQNETKGFGNQSMTGVIAPCYVASRGRNPENLSDRATGSPTEQRLKANTNGTTNTITTVAKDNYVMEPIRIGNIYGDQFGTGYAGNVWDQDYVSPTIMTAQGGNRQPLIVDNIKRRIRKLTPKEYWRLMGFTDDDCDRASKYVSNSALYKQAGNSICTCCLVAIFNALFLNDYTTSYKDKLVDYSKS